MRARWTQGVRRPTRTLSGDEPSEQEESNELRGPDEARMYRAVVARSNYIAIGRASV